MQTTDILFEDRLLESEYQVLCSICGEVLRAWETPPPGLLQFPLDHYHEEHPATFEVTQ